MKTNWQSSLVGSKVVLVPYLRVHVEKYHKWMTSTELQQLTGSEPLSLEEEYEMQKSWHQDPDKCTFIVLDKQKYAESKDEVQAMIGDTNLFISQENATNAEAEIMVADPEARGKKMGWEAMLLMLRYGMEQLGIQRYEVKIKTDNAPSIKMFQKIGFLEISKSDIFQEITFELTPTETFVQWIKNAADYVLDTYDNQEE